MPLVRTLTLSTIAAVVGRQITCSRYTHEIGRGLLSKAQRVSSLIAPQEVRLLGSSSHPV